MTSGIKGQRVVALVAATGLNAGIFNLRYFLGGGNTLPLQLFLGMASFLLLFRIKAMSRAVICVSAASILALIGYNANDPTSVATNPCIPLFGVMAILAGAEFEPRNSGTLDRSLRAFMVFQIAIHVFYNSGFNPGDSFTGRAKGYGSGTTYALMAAVQLIYIASRWGKRPAYPLPLLALAAIPIWSIAQTQSRGAALSLVIIAIIKSLARLRKLMKMISVVVLASLAAILNPELVADVGIVRRLNLSRAADLSEFTGGRSDSQAELIRQISESGALELFMGVEGLNGVKGVVDQGYEYPHLDILYIFYDTGIVGAGLYMALMAVMILRAKWHAQLLLFFLSGIHTNMLVTPVFLIIAVAMYLGDGGQRQGPIGTRGNVVNGHVARDPRHLKA